MIIDKERRELLIRFMEARIAGNYTLQANGKTFRPSVTLAQQAMEDVDAILAELERVK